MMKTIKMMVMVVLCFALYSVALSADWPQWLGPTRDGMTTEVPTQLPAEMKPLWKFALNAEAHNGIAVSGMTALVGDFVEAKIPDPAPDTLPPGKGILYAVDLNTGNQLWKFEYDEKGKDNGDAFDYGNVMRATPVVADGKAFICGASGTVFSVDMITGKEIWHKKLAEDFNGAAPEWGYSSSLIIVDGKLILNPGGADAAIVAVNPATGETIWKTAGDGATYSSLISGNFGGVSQLVGYDGGNLCGWEVATGKRIWKITPAENEDYLIGSPVNVDGKLLVAGTKNFTRLYTFGKLGKINTKPAAVNEDLTPDMPTPIYYKGLVYGICNNGIICLDPAKKLKKLWSNDALPGATSFGMLFAGNDRVLVCTYDGDAYLLEATGTKLNVISEAHKLFSGYAFPAVASGKLIARSAKELACYSLK